MNVFDLMLGLGVEVDELLARWGVRSLVIVRGESVQDTLRASGDAVGLVGGLGLLGGLVFGVEILEGLEEAVGNTVLLVEIESALSSLVTNHVAVSEVLCDDAGSWLLLLGNLIRVLGGDVFLNLLCALGSRDRDLRLAKLGVVEE